jgi:hypothetical protein
MKMGRIAAYSWSSILICGKNIIEPLKDDDCAAISSDLGLLGTKIKDLPYLCDFFIQYT